MKFKKKEKKRKKKIKCAQAVITILCVVSLSFSTRDAFYIMVFWPLTRDSNWTLKLYKSSIITYNTYRGYYKACHN